MAVIESVLIRPLDLPHSEELVQVNSEPVHGGAEATFDNGLTYNTIGELQRNARSVAGVSGYATELSPISVADGTRIAVLVRISQEFFQVLGVHAMLGRLSGPNDSNTQVAVVNEEFWRERLSAKATAIGSTIRISGHSFVVIGVLPKSVHAPLGVGFAAVYLPFQLNGADNNSTVPLPTLLSAIARLKPGVSIQQASAEMQNIYARSTQNSGERGKQLVIRAFRAVVVGDIRKALLSIFGGVGVLFLIVCVNATNLQIGRVMNRTPELMTRVALGASFRRISQLLVTEAMLISLLGATFGSGFCYFLIASLRRAYGTEYPRFDELSVRPLVLCIAGMLAILLGALISIVPALCFFRQRTMLSQTRSRTRRSRVPGMLVSLQVALTVALLVTGGLFFRTLHALQDVSLGFDPRGITTLVLFPDDLQQSLLLTREIELRLLHSFEALPGVQSVAMQSSVPFSNYDYTLGHSTEVLTRTFHEGDSANYSLVSTDFVHASGIRLLRGRGFLQRDEASAAMVVLVNEAFQKKYLGGFEPIGASIHLHRDAKESNADLPLKGSMTIVGVVENEVQGQDLDSPYQPMVYLDLMQLPKDSPWNAPLSLGQYAVRSALAPTVLAAELRSVVKRDGPTMAEMSLQPMSDGITESLGQRQLALHLVAGFGIIAVVLSAIGIYGVQAHAVAVRKREIGIRVALGSSRGSIAYNVVSQAGIMVLFGLIPGSVGAWAAGHAIQSFLYGVKVLDSATFVAVGIVLLLVAVAAASLPALRAAQIDPVEALRAD
jgi:predicted permease